MTIQKMKRERAKCLQKTRAEKVKENAKFSEIAETVERQFIAGQPHYLYQVKNNEVKEHQLYWQTHPKYSKIISFVTSEKYTKTNVSIIIYFKM